MNKNKFNEKLKNNYRKKEYETEHMNHNYSYHRFFENYEEKVIIDEKGKKHIQRRYVGTTYQKELTNKQTNLIKIGYFLLFLFSIMCFIIGASRETIANNIWYVVVSILCTIITFLILLGVIIIYSITPQKMTIDDYRTSSHLKIVTSSLMITISITILLTIINGFISKNNIIQYFYSVAFYIVAIILIHIINYIEKKIKYKEIPFTGIKDENSVEIES